MSKPSVAQFISDKRAEGKSDSEITHILLENGWQIDVINKTMHGEPIRKRDLTPILRAKKRPIRSIVYTTTTLVVFILLILTAIYI